MSIEAEPVRLEPKRDSRVKNSRDVNRTNRGLGFRSRTKVSKHKTTLLVCNANKAHLSGGIRGPREHVRWQQEQVFHGHPWRWGRSPERFFMR
jgi:hypothetical protein